MMDHDAGESFQSDYEGPIDSYIGTEEPPKDEYNLTWFLFLLLGVGVLFPWNAFISANDYFKVKYAPFPFEFALPLIYNYPNMLLLLAVSAWGDKLPLRGRLLVGFAVEIVVFAVIPMQDALPLSVVSTKTSLGIVLAMASVCGLCAAVLIGTLFGFAGMFPPEYMTAVMSGNGVAGIIIFAVKSATKAGFEKSDPINGPRKSSITYFSVAGGVILACFVALLAMPRMKFVRYYIEKNKRQMSAPAAAASTINDDDSTLLLNNAKQRPATFFTLFRQFWPQALNVFWIFFVCLSVFPGLLFNIPPQYQALQKGWLGALLVGTFQVGDFVGRTLPRFVAKFKNGELVVLVSRKWNWILTTLQSIFFPLVILCVVPLHNPYIGSNIAAFAIIFIFATLNGFSGTIPMIYGPSMVDSKNAARVGTYMAVFLNLGIFLGSHMSFLLLWSVSPSDFWHAFGFS